MFPVLSSDGFDEGEKNYCPSPPNSFDVQFSMLLMEQYLCGVDTI